MYSVNGIPRIGVHLKIDDEGNVKRVLRTENETINLEDTTLVFELLQIANINIDNYVLSMQLMDLLLDEYKRSEGTDRANDILQRIDNSVDIIIEGLKEYDYVLGYLMNLTINMYWHDSYEEPTVDRLNHIIDIFHHWLFISTELVFMFSDMKDGKEIDFEKRCSIFKYCEIITTYTHTDKGLETEYYCKTVLEYYVLLVNRFLEMNYNVQQCKCCGDFFVARTKKKTLYCDRVFDDGKTCKEYGPKLNQIVKAKQDEIIGTYEKAKNKMYKRLQRAEMFGITEKSITPNEYFTWLTNAQEAKQKYLDGKISADEALAIINIEQNKDRLIFKPVRLFYTIFQQFNS